MRMFILMLALLASTPSFASKTCLVFGDSNLSGVAPSTLNGPKGKANQLSLHLLQAERDVVIKNLSSPGHALGAANPTGFKTNAVALMKQMGGAYGAYDCVIVQAMTNDFGRSIPWEDSVNTLRAILTEAKANGKKVMVMDGMWRRNENVKNKLGHTLHTYRWVYAVTCAEFPGTCHFAHRDRSVFKDDTAAVPYYDANEVAADKELHLNAAGNRKLADWMKAEGASAGLF